MFRLFITLFLGLLLFSFQNEIGRIDLLKNNPGIVTLNLEKHRNIAMWTNVDIEFKEKPLFVYGFDFIKGSEIILQGGVDPLVVTNVRDEIKTDTSWSFYGKLEGNFVPQQDTVYQIKTTFLANKPKGLKIKKLEVVFLD